MSYLSKDYQAKTSGKIIYNTENIKRWIKNSTMRAVYHANRAYGDSKPRTLDAVLNRENRVHPRSSIEHVDEVYVRNATAVKELSAQHAGTYLGSALDDMTRAYTAWWESQFVKVRSGYWREGNHI